MDRVKQNIIVDTNYTADGVTFFMCNFKAVSPKTVLTNVKNCTFTRCNLFGCEVDDSNTLVKSASIDTTVYPAEPTEEELKERVTQLETFITDNDLIVPTKAVV